MKKYKLFRMNNKLQHYINRYRYNKSHTMLPDIKGGSGACGQDILIHQLSRRKKDGVFVDIGANDGVSISNTLMLEKDFGWSGIAVEPIPSVYEKLRSNRKCHMVHGCVTPKAGKAKFLEMVGGPNMLSTLAMNNVGLTARRLRKNAERHKAIINEIDVDCYTLQSLVNRFEIKRIDFLSVDTEGGELEILQSIDFDAIPVGVISVENNYYIGSIRRFLESEGFLYVGTFKIDEIYVFGGDELRRVIKK